MSAEFLTGRHMSTLRLHGEAFGSRRGVDRCHSLDFAMAGPPAACDLDEEIRLARLFGLPTAGSTAADSSRALAPIPSTEPEWALVPIPSTEPEQAVAQPAHIAPAGWEVPPPRPELQPPVAYLEEQWLDDLRDAGLIMARLRRYPNGDVDFFSAITGTWSGRHGQWNEQYLHTVDTWLLTVVCRYTRDKPPIVHVFTRSGADSRRIPLGPWIGNCGHRTLRYIGMEYAYIEPSPPPPRGSVEGGSARMGQGAPPPSPPCNLLRILFWPLNAWEIRLLFFGATSKRLLRCSPAIKSARRGHRF